MVKRSPVFFEALFIEYLAIVIIKALEREHIRVIACVKQNSIVSCKHKYRKS